VAVIVAMRVAVSVGVVIAHGRTPIR
jgi:hypothetical protein